MLGFQRRTWPERSDAQQCVKTGAWINAAARQSTWRTIDDASWQSVHTTKYRASFIVVKFVFDQTCLSKWEGGLQMSFFPCQNIFNPICLTLFNDSVPPPPYTFPRHVKQQKYCCYSLNNLLILIIHLMISRLLTSDKKIQDFLPVQHVPVATFLLEYIFQPVKCGMSCRKHDWIS